MKHLVPEITHQSSSTSEKFVNCIYDISREVLQEEYCSLKRYMINTDGGSYHVNETINRRTGAINRIQKQIKQNKLKSNQPASTRTKNVAHEK
jgi:hypothetical protein